MEPTLSEPKTLRILKPQSSNSTSPILAQFLCKGANTSVSPAKAGVTHPLRENKYELQYRFLCKLIPLPRVPELNHFVFVCAGTRCTLPVGYQVVAPSAKADFIYLNYGAMTQQQGYVPPEAFAGEDEVHERMETRGTNISSVEA